jgi:hypothetical protein
MARLPLGSLSMIALLALRLVAAAGLAVDAGVHADLAPLYDGVGASLSLGDLFRIEAGLACLAALCILFVWRRLAALLALVVAVSALAALFVSRYVDLGSIGPFPNMYEPSWYSQKTLAAVSEITTILASAGLLAAVRRDRRDRRERSA